MLRMLRSALMFLPLPLAVALFAWNLPPHSGFTTYAFGGAFAIHLSTRPRAPELLLAVFVSLVLAVEFSIHVGWNWGFTDPALLLSFLGLGSVTSIGFSVVRDADDPALLAAHTRTLGAAIAVPIMAAMAVFALGWTPKLYPQTYDLLLYAYDGALGFQPSFLLGRLGVKHRWFLHLVALGYGALPLGMALVYAGRRRKAAFLVVCAVAGTVGFLFYSVVPAAGPFLAFPDRFPFGSLETAGLGLVELESQAPRNAMPSLHLTWALLMLWNSRHAARWLRPLALTFLTLTLLGTLALGEHYLIDLVVAVPFAVFIQAACATALPLRAAARWKPVALSAAMTLAWLLALRFATPLLLRLSLANWIPVALTVVVPLWLERRLAREIARSHPSSTTAEVVARAAITAGP